MANGINKATILGRLGQDPDMKYTAAGSPVCNLSVATSYKWKDKGTGTQNEITEWHRIVLFGKLAEICGQYLTKGSLAYFEGRIQTRKWQDKQGIERYSTEIIATEMQMLDSKGSSGSSDPARKDPPAQTQASAGAPAQDDGFDDIPF